MSEDLKIEIENLKQEIKGLKEEINNLRQGLSDHEAKKGMDGHVNKLDF